MPMAVTTLMMTRNATPTAVTQKSEFARLFSAEEQEEVGAGDLGQARHDDDVGGDHDPAGHPAGPRTDGSA